jgi:phage-related protein
LFWVGPSRAELRAFPENARRRAGFELCEVQQGRTPSDWRSMPSIGLGVIEIRVHTELEHRVLYVSRFQEGIYVLHAFEKKSSKTPRHALTVARSRLASLTSTRGTRTSKADHG